MFYFTCNHGLTLKYRGHIGWTGLEFNSHLGARTSANYAKGRCGRSSQQKILQYL